MNFNEMLQKSIEDKDREKGYPPMTEAQMMRDPYRHVSLQVNDQLNVYDSEKISSEGSVKQGDKNDGASGSYDEDHAPAEKEIKDDNTSGAYDGKSIGKAESGLPSFGEMYARKQ